MVNPSHYRAFELVADIVCLPLVNESFSRYGSLCRTEKHRAGFQGLSGPAPCGCDQMCRNASHDRGRTSHRNPPSPRQFFDQAAHSQDAYKPQPKPKIQAFPRELCPSVGLSSPQHLLHWLGRFRQRFCAE